VSTPTFTSIIVNQQEVRLDHQGDWDASTNSPTLTSGTGTIGHAYRVSVAGSTTLDSVSAWDVDEFAVFDGTAWIKAAIGGGGGGTILGSVPTVDNALPRASGTAGTTLQGGVAGNNVILDDTGNLLPEASDGGALGTTTTQWADLFLATGGVVNWNNGDVLVTHSAGKLDFTGASSGYQFDNPLLLNERASALSSAAGVGQLWVRNDTPNVLVFTDDAGTDTVLGAGGGLSNRRIARLAQTTNIADLGAGAPDTVDGVLVALNDRILVEGQTAGSENGIYVVDTVGTGSDGSWSRAGDFDDAVADSIQAGIEVYIQEGTAYERSTFFLVTTGAITIGATSLEFLLEGGLARTDASSTEVIAATAFAATAVVSSDIDMRDHTHLAVFFNPTDITSQNDVDIVVYWSDDGTTIPFANDDNILQTDFDIVNQSDGSFQPQPYTARLTTAGGELAANKQQHLIFPKGGGVCRVGVIGDAAGGSFSVRTQRLTR
jgi:hypothetical protein